MLRRVLGRFRVHLTMEPGHCRGIQPRHTRVAAVLARWPAEPVNTALRSISGAELKSQICPVTTSSTASRARFRHASARPVARLQAGDARSSSGGCVTETGTTARTKKGSWSGYCPTPGRPCPAPSGGSPAGRAAAARSGCPASAGRRSPPLRCLDGRACKRGLARPPYLASSYRSRSQSKARLRRVGAPHRRPLSSDLARQDLGTYQVGRGRPSPPSPRLRMSSGG